MKKSKFAESFGKDNYGYYPLFYYTLEIPESSNYYICNSLKPKIKLIPFIGEYSFILPDYSQSIIPNLFTLTGKKKTKKFLKLLIGSIVFLKKNNYSLKST